VSRDGGGRPAAAGRGYRPRRHPVNRARRAPAGRRPVSPALSSVRSRHGLPDCR